MIREIMPPEGLYSGPLRAFSLRIWARDYEEMYCQRGIQSKQRKLLTMDDGPNFVKHLRRYNIPQKCATHSSSPIVLNDHALQEPSIGSIQFVRGVFK